VGAAVLSDGLALYDAGDSGGLKTCAFRTECLCDAKDILLYGAELDGRVWCVSIVTVAERGVSV